MLAISALLSRKNAVAMTVSALLLAVPSPAAAAPGDGPDTTTPVVDAAPTASTAPRSLSEAMVAFYADQSAMTVADFAVRHGDVLDSFGLDPAAFSSMPQAEVPTSDPFAALRERAAAPLPTLEATVISQGSLWAASVATWAMEPRELAVPALGQLPTPSVGLVSPPEGFGTGVLLEQSLTQLITDHPGVFAQVRAAGVGSPAAAQAWRESMLSAYNAVGTDRWASLVDPCSAAYLGTMASGSAATGRAIAGDSCNPCVVAGLYMHGQMGRLFDPGSTSTLFDPNDGLLPPAEWSSLPQWQRDVIADQNPSLTDQLEQSVRSQGSTPTCAGGSTAVSSAAASVLPGVWGNLQP